MKLIKCEVCGGTNIVKADGVFVCQNCGCKYTLEEAQKLMIDGSVEVHGKVTVEGIGSANNYLALAKRFEKNNEYDMAKQYYVKVLETDSSNKEATIRLEKINRRVSLNITREYHMCNWGRTRIYVTIDGEHIASIKNGDTVSYSIKPGVYTIAMELSRGNGSILKDTLVVRPDDASVNIVCQASFMGSVSGEW